jgi:transposase
LGTQVLERLVRSVLERAAAHAQLGHLLQDAGLHLSVRAAVPCARLDRRQDKAMSGKHTALVELNGVIAHDSPASAERINAGLQEAFKDGNTAGVIVRVNSPGGSPVQAARSTAKIRRLRGLHPQIPLYVWSTTSAHPAAITSRRRQIASMSIRRAWSARSACSWTASASPARWRSSASSGG